MFQTRLVQEQKKHWNDPSHALTINKLQTLLRLQRERVKTLLHEHKNKQTYRVRSRLQRNNMRLNNFYKFLRQHCRATKNITAAYNESGQVVFNQPDVAKEVVSKWSTVFCGQQEKVFNEKALPELPSLDSSDPLLRGLPHSPPKKHEAFLCRPFNPTSLKDLLQQLKDNKSRGADNIPSEVLKYADDNLLQYLLIFYNKILKLGIVPESLNVIKCVLIHKSGDTLDLLNYRPIAIPSCLLRPITIRLSKDMSRIAETEGLLGKHIKLDSHWPSTRKYIYISLCGGPCGTLYY